MTTVGMKRGDVGGKDSASHESLPRLPHAWAWKMITKRQASAWGVQGLLQLSADQSRMPRAGAACPCDAAGSCLEMLILKILLSLSWRRETRSPLGQASEVS